MNKHMDKEELVEKADLMMEQMGKDRLLMDLMSAMTSDELQSNLEYIDRMWETNVF